MRWPAKNIQRLAQPCIYGLAWHLPASPAWLSGSYPALLLVKRLTI